MTDVPEVDPVAAEIYRNFCRKMRPGGYIDQILNGGEPVTLRPALPDSELEPMKRNIEVQLDEYEAAIEAAKVWFRDWCERQRPPGFRKTIRTERT